MRHGGISKKKEADVGRALGKRLAPCVADIFCGAGGLSYGFRQQGLDGAEQDFILRQPRQKCVGAPRRAQPM